TRSNSVAGLSVGRQTNLADSDSPSPLAPSGATGAPSSLSSSNLGPPEIPSSSLLSPKLGTPEIPSPEIPSPSSLSSPESGTPEISSASSSTTRAARVAGAAVLFALFLTTRARRWASRA
ncbi:hypothetical protein C0991_001598, partial [Blastosporella zonata]